MNKNLLVLTTTLIFISLLGSAQATVVVNQTTPACEEGDSYFNSINNAIGNLTSGGETILICNGTYAEDVYNTLLNYSVTIRGESREGVIINNSAFAYKDAQFVLGAGEGLDIRIHDLTSQISDYESPTDYMFIYADVFHGNLTIENVAAVAPLDGYSESVASWGAAANWSDANIVIRDSDFTSSWTFYIDLNSITALNTFDIRDSSFTASDAVLIGTTNAYWINVTSNYSTTGYLVLSDGIVAEEIIVTNSTFYDVEDGGGLNFMLDDFDTFNFTNNRIIRGGVYSSSGTTTRVPAWFVNNTCDPCLDWQLTVSNHPGDDTDIYFVNNTINMSPTDAFYVEENAVITGNIISGADLSFRLYSSLNASNNTFNDITSLKSLAGRFYDNIVNGTSGALGTGWLSTASAYNNIFYDITAWTVNNGNMNTSLQADINIIGGPYIGGNYYANSAGTGFSQTCSDEDIDQICDSPYDLSGAVDYLPLKTDTSAPAVSVSSPANTTYELGAAITVSYSASESVDTSSDVYSLDGDANASLDNGSTQVIPALGSHNLTVWANDSNGNLGVTTVYFTVTDTTPPGLTLLSPGNSTYQGTTSQLNYSVDEATSWIGYSLDSGANITLEGNTTLSSLTNGSHTLTMWANDTQGNLQTATIGFSMNSSMLGYYRCSENCSEINASNIGAFLETAYQNASGPVNLTMYSAAQRGTSGIGISVLDSSIEINASQEFKAGLTWAFIRIYYTDEDLDGTGVAEEDLVMHWLNESSGEWVVLSDSMDWVYGLGVNTSAKYVWANVSHFSDYTIGAVAAPAPAQTSPSSSGGGASRGAVRIGATGDILIVANSIDYAMASGFISYLKKNNLATKVVKPAEFTPDMRTGNRLIILLGGPDAPEGMGEIVDEMLSDSEKESLRDADSQQMFFRYNPYTDRFWAKQLVIVVAGSDRANTQAAGDKYNSKVKIKVMS